MNDEVFNQISNLFSVECPDSPKSACLVIWSSGAQEQLEAILQNDPEMKQHLRTLVEELKRMREALWMIENGDSNEKLSDKEKIDILRGIARAALSTSEGKRDKNESY